MRPTTQVLAASVTVAVIALAGCGTDHAVSGTAPPGATAPAPALLATAPAASTPSVPAAGSTITTEGTGAVSGTPNVMTVSIGVQTTAPRAGDALSQNNTVATAVQAVLARDGVAVADIQTGELSLYAQQQDGSASTVGGYQVSDVVTATLRNLGKAGSVIDDALAAAGDAGRLQGVSFSVADDSPLLSRARQQAVASARQDAQEMASAAGVKLVGLRSLSDQTSSGVPYATAGQPFAAGAHTASAAPVPVQPGTQQTTVQVTAVWDVSP
ncbi:MAG TPA: SIMPL domain-containing protein [Acidimicrobiales bacterium]|jgi:hypothetical protein|nr:SIMPL domain-containing protein [Acidimicrobiales bacterium]